MAGGGGVEEDRGAAAERRVGSVRGFLTVRNEVANVARKIEMYSLPDLDGPLQPVD